jgi:glyoxylase-like metal-dependent hydrolase (beta-lactamase superfamily II)
MRDVTSIPLLTGSCRHPERMTIAGGSWRPATFESTAMLLLHPDAGPILFDTGYDPAFIAATQPLPERAYRWLTPVTLRDGGDAASQCRALGVDPADVRHLILSHFHADHMAGTHAFPNATIHCSAAGYAAACKGGRVNAVRQGVVRALFPPDFAARARFFEDGTPCALPRDLLPFTHGVDLLGDGALMAVPLPGHCPGHWGLLISDSRFGLHFLVADAAWSSDAIRRNVPPPALTSNFLGDGKQARATLQGLHDLAQRNPDIRLSPCHCPERATEARTDAARADAGQAGTP